MGANILRNASPNATASASPMGAAAYAWRRAHHENSAMGPDGDVRNAQAPVVLRAVKAQDTWSAALRQTTLNGSSSTTHWYKMRCWVAVPEDVEEQLIRGSAPRRRELRDQRDGVGEVGRAVQSSALIICAEMPEYPPGNT